MRNIKVLLLLAFLTPCLAQAVEEGEEGFNRNGIELFGGATFNHGETDASVGLSYERRVTHPVGNMKKVRIPT